MKRVAMVKIFNTFFLKLILEEAISYEEKAYHFYESARKRVVKAESALVLRRLLAKELEYRIRLQEMQRKGDLGEIAVSAPEEIERLERINEEWPVINPWASKMDILRIAWNREQTALNFYKTLRDRSIFRFTKNIFDVVLKEKVHHMHLIRTELDKEKQRADRLNTP